MRTPGSKDLLPFRRRLQRKRPAIREGTLIAYDSRNSFGRKEEIVVQRSYCTWVPHAIALLIKNKTLRRVRQQKLASPLAFSSPSHHVVRLPGFKGAVKATEAVVIKPA